MAEDSDFHIGSLVFAKMKGFPYWPGLICNNPPELKKSALDNKPGYWCVRFFGTDNYSSIETDKLKHYLENKDELCAATKTAGFKKACNDIENYINNGYKFPDPEPTTSNLKRSSTSSLKELPKYKGKRTKPSTDKAGDATSTVQSTGKKWTSTRSVKQRGKKVVPENIDASEESPTVSRTSSEESLSDISQASSDESPAIAGASSVRSLPRPSFTMGNERYSFLSSSTFDRIPRPESPPLNIRQITDTLANKKIVPSALKFGFLGLGKMGSGLVKNLVNSGHHVTVWNRTGEKCSAFQDAGAYVTETPMDVVLQADITFCCVSDNTAASLMAFGNCGVMHEMKPGKAYVEMSGIDAETSQSIRNAVTAAGGRYLEVRVHGTRAQAEEGTLVLHASGDETVYNDCMTCFSAMSVSQTFVGTEVGGASSMSIISQAMVGTGMVLLSELTNIGNHHNVPTKELLDLFVDMELLNPFLRERCLSALSGDTKPQVPLKHIQKNTHLYLQMGSKHNVCNPTTARANEQLKWYKSLGYRDLDIGSVILPK